MTQTKGQSEERVAKNDVGGVCRRRDAKPHHVEREDEELASCDDYGPVRRA
jgi:hypothetical protein